MELREQIDDVIGRGEYSELEYKNVGSMSEVQLSDKQKRICELIANDPSISAKQMSVVLRVTQRTVERDLSAMQKMGVLVREGNTSAGRWVLQEDSKD